MHLDPPHVEGRVRRLREELAELGYVPADQSGYVPADGSDPVEALFTELDYALHPVVFERRIPSYGAVVGPSTDVGAWESSTSLSIAYRPTSRYPLIAARRFADGLSSWLVRESDGTGGVAVFDRPAGSERDLVVLSAAMGATLVQRHPSGVVRIAGSHGVLRWDGLSWHAEPPVARWIESMGECLDVGDRQVLTQLLEFAVHDLGARGIGALFVYRAGDDPGPGFEERLPTPPPLRISNPTDLAPLRHVLAQVDGATVFDRSGVLRQLGARLVPSAEAEAGVDGFRGMRHTSARRYSFDDPTAMVIVVSEDGPVTVLRNGEFIGRSDPS